VSELRIVSTFSPDQWAAFARKNVQTWLEHIDAEFVLYHEGEHPPNLQSPRIMWRCWDEIPCAVEFVEDAINFAPACGRFGTQYDYNYDARRFAHKAYAQIDAAKEPGDLLLWLDADVELTRELSADRLEEMLAGAPMATFQRPGYHSETGVVLWDLRHPKAAEFFRGYERLYDSRRIYCIPRGWHDCWALDYVVEQLRIPCASLTKVTRDYGTPGANLHVVPESELGAYLRHDKGARKYAA